MSHINKIEVIQAKILRTIVNGSWYVRSEDIRRDLGVPTVKEEISRYSEKYKSRIATHPNRLFFFYYLLEYLQSILVENFQ